MVKRMQNTYFLKSEFPRARSLEWKWISHEIKTVVTWEARRSSWELAQCLPVRVARVSVWVCASSCPGCCPLNGLLSFMNFSWGTGMFFLTVVFAQHGAWGELADTWGSWYQHCTYPFFSRSIVLSLCLVHECLGVAFMMGCSLTCVSRHPQRQC